MFISANDLEAGHEGKRQQGLITLVSLQSPT